MKRILFFAFLFTLSLHSFSQQLKIDSLHTLLKKDKVDTGKVNHLNKLCWEYITIGSYDTAFRYGNAALQSAKSLNFSKGIASAYGNIGVIYNNQGNYDKALEYHSSSLKISEELNEKPHIASSYNNLGVVYYDRGNYSKALENHLISLKIREEIGDKKGASYTYNNIGLVYSQEAMSPIIPHQKRAELLNKALESYFSSLKIREEIGDKKGMAASYINIGIVYDEQAALPFTTIQKKKELLNRTLGNYFLALKINKEIGDKEGIAVSYNNLGTIYSEQGALYDTTLSGNSAEHEKRRELLDKGLQNYFVSLKLFEEIGNKHSIATCFVDIAYVYVDKLNYTEAGKWFQKGLQLAKEIGAKQLLMDTYGKLSEVSEKKGDYQNAYKYHRLYTQVKDSIFNEVNNKQIAEMQTKYETGKKEKEIKLLNKENEIKTLQITEQRHQLFNHRILFSTLFAGIILIIAISWLLISRDKIRQKEVLKTELLKQQELRTKSIIETQEQERKRIAQDLHDGIGQTLAGIKINFAAISDKTEFVSEENRKIFHQTIISLDDAYKEVRTLSHSMMPKALKESGLTDAIDDLLEKTLANSTTKYNFEKDNTLRFDENIEIGLYRVFQELLNNILKHSNASEIAVHLRKTKDQIILMVEDNGIGIIQNQSNGKNGVGLSNIEARVYALNGTFSISAGVHRGTVAVVRIPVSVKSS